ncbi:MAG: hypothetical protein IT585_09745 [candidate division Zixibacteria bacterium]|nr:hypothetical protein [candidate division Zixibacteria bacterium]
MRTAVVAGLLISVALCAPALAEWENLGLNDRLVRAIATVGDYLFAATDSGVYRTLTIDPLPQWVHLGLSDHEISALMVLDLDTIFAGTASGDATIYRSVDGGASWLPFQNGYGGGSVEPVLAFNRLPNQKDTLLATGLAVIARSTDRGLSWQPRWGDWSGWGVVVFAKVDRRNPSIVWAGGEGAIFNPWLFKSTDRGENWELINVVYTGDNRCHDIAIHPSNSDLAYVSMEGQVQRTENGGDDWQIIATNGYYLYSVEIDSLRPNNLYVSTAQLNEPLMFLKSSNGGQTWSEVVDLMQPDTPTYDMLLISYSKASILYMATRHGVFCYTDPVHFLCGDADGSGAISISDAVCLINYIFAGGPAPDPLAAGDADSSGTISISDAVYVINYIFAAGPVPCEGHR